MSGQQTVVRARVERDEKFRFTASFPDLDGAAPVLVDEDLPLGEGAGPNPARLLAAALGSCLAASFVFCLQKMRVDPMAVGADVSAEIVRNERGRLRIGGVDVDLTLDASSDQLAQLDRCEQLFEDFCIVTESVRHGIPVRVHVKKNEALPSS